MKFQNPFDLFNNYLDKSKNNIEPFDNEIEDVSNEIKDRLKGYAADPFKDDEKPKKEFDYGIGFMIIILVTVFIIQCIAYFFSLKIEKKRTADEMIKILDNPTWSFPFFVSVCFWSFCFLFLAILGTVHIKFGIPMMPWQSLNFYNLMFIVFILTLVLLLGSHILFIFFPSFIEIFENTIGYGVINLGIASSRLTTSTKSLSGVFGDRLKIKALPSFNIGLEFLITYFTLSKFSESFQSFIQDILSDGKNEVGEEVSSISQFSDFELKKEFGISDEFIKAINERKIENNKDPNNPPYDFMKDQSLKELGSEKFANDFKNLNDFKKDLFELTLAKYRIGSFCWSYFISTIIFIGSMNAFIT